jgi:DNA repair protein RadC
MREPKAINFWPRDDRPREKLLKNGEHTLSNSELLAILIRTGVRGQSALDLARKILARFKTFRGMADTDHANWKVFKGLGSAKLAQIKAAIEIGRRLSEETIGDAQAHVTSSADTAALMMARMRDLKREVFKVLILNARNRVMEIVEITEGSVDQAYPIIRNIFQSALQHAAVSLICVHNHPSGAVEPSREDIQFTRQLTAAGSVMGIPVLDHIIIGDNVYYSFADHGRMDG